MILSVYAPWDSTCMCVRSRAEKSRERCGEDLGAKPFEFEYLSPSNLFILQGLKITHGGYLFVFAVAIVYILLLWKHDLYHFLEVDSQYFCESVSFCVYVLYVYIISTKRVPACGHLQYTLHFFTCCFWTVRSLNQHFQRFIYHTPAFTKITTRQIDNLSLTSCRYAALMHASIWIKFIWNIYMSALSSPVTIWWHFLAAQ